MYREATCIFAAPPARDDFVGPALDPTTETHSVCVPYIVNTVRVDPDKELILKWQMLVKEKRKTPGRTWVDDVAQH